MGNLFKSYVEKGAHTMKKRLSWLSLVLIAILPLSVFAESLPLNTFSQTHHWKQTYNAHNRSIEIDISQLKFLYPLKTLVFPAFLPPRFGPFPSFFPLREEMRETFFRPSLPPYPVALRKFAWPLWWRGRKCSSWYLHQNVPAAPAHPWVRPRGREGWSYMYASTDGNENHPYPRSSFGSIGIRC